MRGEWGEGGGGGKLSRSGYPPGTGVGELPSVQAQYLTSHLFLSEEK